MVPNNVVEAAKAQAKLSTHRFRIGAVFYTGRDVLGRGFNDHTKTHPMSPHPFRTKHAEFSAILDTFGSHNGNFYYYPVSKHWHLYVHRLKADGSPGLAKPCQWCWGMISQLGISKVDWSEG